MRELARYSFVNARVRALLSRLLEEDFWRRRLTQATDFQSLLNILGTTVYKETVSGITGNKEYLLEFERRIKLFDLAIFRKLIQSIAEGPERNLLLLLLQRYEVDELKTALRLWFGKPAVDPADYLLGQPICSRIDFSQIVAARSLEEIIVLLEETDFDRALRNARNRFQETGSLFVLESTLDIDYYRRLLAAVDNLSSRDRLVAGTLIGLIIDLENINWLLRQRVYYSLGLEEFLEWVIPGGRHITAEDIRRSYTVNGAEQIVKAVSRGPYEELKKFERQDFHLIESFLYEVLLHQVRKILAGFPFTIGTVLGYLILKQRESKTIVSLARALSAGLVGFTKTIVFH